MPYEKIHFLDCVGDGFDDRLSVDCGGVCGGCGNGNLLYIVLCDKSRLFCRLRRVRGQRGQTSVAASHHNRGVIFGRRVDIF